MLNDLRLALRSIRREPVVCCAVVAILAISIGAHTATFALVHAALLRPIADRDEGRMVVVESVSTKTGGSYGLSVADADDYLQRSETLETIGSFESRMDNLLLDSGEVLAAPSAVVTSGVLPATGVAAWRGRLFTEDDDRQGADSFKALVSHALWRSHFGGREDIVGHRLQTSLGTYTVVGLLPPGFGYPEATQIWFPYQNWIDTQDTTDTRVDQRSSRWSEGVARLSADVTVEQAQEELAALGEVLATEHPKTNELWRPRLTLYREAQTATLRPHLRSLFLLTWVSLGLAVITLASLQTARGISRLRQFALQRALGAPTKRVVGQLLLETLLLAGAGGLLGFAVAHLALRGVPYLVQQSLPTWIEPRIGWAELGVGAVTVLGMSLIAGLSPVSLLLRNNLRALVGERGGSSSASGSRLRGALVVAEIAMAMLLIVVAMLLGASFRQLTTQDPGFDPTRVVTVELSPQFRGDYFEQTDELARFYQRVQSELETVPGVVAVGGTTKLPYLDIDRTQVTVLARGGTSEEELEHLAPVMTIDSTPGYFNALGIGMVEGRDLAWDDTRDKGMVIVLSHRAASLLFPGQPALNKEVRISGDSWARVVGVVEDVRYNPRETDFGAELYYPITQYKAWRQRLVVRTDANPAAVVDGVRAKLAEIAPETGVVEIRTLAGIMDQSLWQARLLATLGPLFAVVSLVLAALGIYGLMRSELGLRRREFGVRAALGASLVTLGRLVVSRGLRLVAAGTAVGLGAAIVLGPALSASLFGVSAHDPLIYGVAGLVLIVGGVAACIVPALRAMRVNPTEALREA